MKTFKQLNEYLGGFRLGSFPTMKPMASLGDKGPNKPAGQQSLGVGINAAYSSQAPGTMRPFLTADAKKLQIKNWSSKGFGPKTEDIKNTPLYNHMLEAGVIKKEK